MTFSSHMCTNRPSLAGDLFVVGLTCFSWLLAALSLVGSSVVSVCSLAFFERFGVVFIFGFDLGSAAGLALGEGAGSDVVTSGAKGSTVPC